MLKIKCGDKYLHTFQCLIQAKVYTNFHSFFELLRFNKSLSLPQKCFLVSFIQLFWKNLFTNLLPPVHCQMLFVTLLSTPWVQKVLEALTFLTYFPAWFILIPKILTLHRIVFAFLPFSSNPYQDQHTTDSWSFISLLQLSAVKTLIPQQQILAALSLKKSPFLLSDLINIPVL